MKSVIPLQMDTLEFERAVEEASIIRKEANDSFMESERDILWGTAPGTFFGHMVFSEEQTL